MPPENCGHYHELRIPFGADLHESQRDAGGSVRGALGGKISDTSGFLYTDGKLYGLPLASQDYWGFCANKNVLAECGLEVPTSKEELVACFDVLKEKGYIPFYSGAGDAWMCGNITASGLHADMEKDPDLVTKFNTNQMGYKDSESFKAMLQDIQDWAEAGYFGDNFMSQTWDGMQDAVANDKCGFSIGLTSWLTSMDTTYGAGTSDKLELIPYYIGENEDIYMSTCCELYVSKDSENIDIAKHFLNWCCQDENLQQFYDGIGAASILTISTATTSVIPLRNLWKRFLTERMDCFFLTTRLYRDRIGILSVP